MNDTSSIGRNNKYHLKRRDFISTSIKAAGATALLSTPVINLTAKYAGVTKAYTVQEIINII